MARYKFQGVFRDQEGNIVTTQSDGSETATCSVTLTGTSTAASIYTSSTPGGVAVSSVNTDAYGRFLFYVDNLDYDYNQGFDLTLSKSGWTSQLYSNLTMAANMSVVLGTYTLTNNKTVTTHVKAVDGVLYNGAFNLTFNGVFEAGLFQCFGMKLAH